MATLRSKKEWTNPRPYLTLHVMDQPLVDNLVDIIRELWMMLPDQAEDMGDPDLNTVLDRVVDNEGAAI